MSAEPLQPAEVVKACLDEPSAANWEAFVRLFQPTIAAGAISVVRLRNLRPKPDLIDDLIQETYLKICKDDRKVLRDFIPQGDESAFGYFKVVAINCSRDHFRRKDAIKRGKEEQQGGENDPDEKDHREKDKREKDKRVALVGSLENQILLDEMKRHLEGLVESVRDRDIFWLYYREGFNTREIAALPNIGLSAKGVESLIFRLTRLLREAIGPFALPEEGGQK